jgi:phosphatidylglycerophosphatase A
MNNIVLAITSVFGTGYIKYAPGTFGTFVGLLLWFFLIPKTPIAQIIAIIAIIIVSIISSSAAEKIYAKKDDGRIVIDEVAGIWFSLMFLPDELVFYILAFLLFRFFDVKKPFFIKNLQNIKGGLGVVIDDVVAGIIVNIILQAGIALRNIF